MPNGGSFPWEKIFDELIRIVGVIGKYGVAALVFALPPIIGCFGVYFLAVAINDPQVLMAKVSVGIFATVFGSGLSIVLLYLFTNMKLWDILGLSKLSQEQQKLLADLEVRVKTLEAQHTRQLNVAS